jgi:hypothetical protein
MQVSKEPNNTASTMGSQSLNFYFKEDRMLLTLCLSGSVISSKINIKYR